MKRIVMIVAAVLLFGCKPGDKNKETNVSEPDTANASKTGSLKNGLYRIGDTTECLCIDFENKKLVSVMELQLAPPVGARDLTETNDGFRISYSKNFQKAFPEVSSKLDHRISVDQEGHLKIFQDGEKSLLTKVDARNSSCEIQGPADASYDTICQYNTPSVAAITSNKEAIAQYLNINASQENNDPAKTRYVTVKSGLRLRKEASTNAESLVTIPYGEAVLVDDSFFPRGETIDGVKGRWFKVSYQGKNGFAFNGNTNQRKFSNGNGYLSFVPPDASILFAGDCTTHMNFDPQSDTYSSSIVLLENGTGYEIQSDSGDGEYVGQGKYTVQGNEYSLPFGFIEETKKLVKTGAKLVEKSASSLLEKNPDILKEWAKNKLPVDADESKLKTVLVCE